MRKLTLILALVMLTSLLATAAAVTAQDDDMSLPEFLNRTECEADLSGEVLPLYHFGDISRSYAPITQPLITGVADAIDYFNARGGICGAEIEQVNRDTENNPDLTQSIYDDFSTRDDKPLMIILYSSPDSEQLRTQLAEDEIPVIISAGSVEGLYGESGDEPGWIYATNPLYIDQLGDFCEYVGANTDEFPENPTIGYISWPGAFGEAAYTPETIAYCGEQGVGFVESPELFLPTATDVFTEVQNLVDAGANILYTNTLASGPPVVARTIVELGLENEVVLAGAVWTLDSSAGLIDQQTRRENGLPAIDGMYGSMPFRWWTETNNEAVQFLISQFDFYAEQNGRSPEDQIRLRNISYILGWSSVDLYIELVTRTINRVGVEELSGATMKETIDMTEFEPMGLQFFDFNGGDIRDVEQNRIARYGFANSDFSGPATSAEDANTDFGFFFPIVIPLTEFEASPDLRPGMMDMDGE